MREVGHQFDADKVSLWSRKACLLFLSIFWRVLSHLQASFVLMLKILSILVDLIGRPRDYNFDNIEDISFKRSFIVILDGQYYPMLCCDNGRFYLHQQLLILEDVMIEALRGRVVKVDVKALSLVECD